MTDIDTSVETLARRIADRGQDALLGRLRTAYADAAAAHADLISLDSEQIEAMVQSAADNADGLQWRRALADVARRGARSSASARRSRTRRSPRANTGAGRCALIRAEPR